MATGWFNPDASANELGLHVRIGAQVTCVPDAVYAAPESLVRLVQREIDADFRPLWVNIWWRSPNGGVVKTGHHILARHVLHPLQRAPIIPGLLLPALPTYGVSWRPPLLLATTLDGLTDEERNAGRLPRYVPFDGQVVRSMRFAMWRRNNASPNERSNQSEQAEAAAAQRAQKAIVDGLTERKKDERLRILRAAGKADYVYVRQKGVA